MRKFGIALIVALIAIMTMSGAVLADDPTDVNMDWEGGGWVSANVNTGDADAGFETGGGYINGSYTATDSNNNPYSYGVDSFSACLNASVENGIIDAGCLRTDSYPGMYGDAGQSSWSFVGVDDGTASMAYCTTTNYAQMRDCSYGSQLLGGHNIVVDGAYFEIDRGIQDGRGNEGFLDASGTGSATLDCMSAEASGCWALSFGRGCGCFTDANYHAVGSGEFEVTGIGVNGVTFNGMGLSSGGGSLGIVANYVNSFDINDYSLTAN